MKLMFTTIIAGMTLLSLPVMSQVVSKDSISNLKEEKNVLALSNEINGQKLKLAKLENSVEGKRQDMEKAQKDAQRSADENADIASKLTNDPDNRKLARRAKRAAKSVKRDARQSRIATDNFEELQRDIEQLRKKLADNEERLSAMKG